MEAPERIRGRYALSVVAGLALASGCGNSVPELLQLPPAITAVSDADHHDMPIKQAGGLEIGKRGETGASGAPRSDGDPDCLRDTRRTRVRNGTVSGSRPTRASQDRESPCMLSKTNNELEIP